MSEVHVRVRAGGEDYALPVDGVLEITELGDLAPVPGSASEVLGARNLRGQVIPVVDLAVLFGLQDSGERQRIVVAEHHGVRVGLAVEGVLDVGVLPQSSEAVESPLLSGATLLDGRLVGIVDLEAVLGGLVAERAA